MLLSGDIMAKGRILVIYTLVKDVTTFPFTVKQYEEKVRYEIISTGTIEDWKRQKREWLAIPHHRKYRIEFPIFLKIDGMLLDWMSRL